MFNFKFSILDFKRFRNRKDRLPVDFGTMYFLYPSETGQYVGFRSTGLMDKIIDMVKSPLANKKEDADYFKAESYF